MSRPLLNAHWPDVDRVALAIEHLKQARDLLKPVSTPKTIARVRLAITSAGGALRHAERRARAAERLADEAFQRGFRNATEGDKS